jgi:hypothetical protein
MNIEVDFSAEERLRLVQALGDRPDLDKSLS